mgnify:FL=1
MGFTRSFDKAKTTGADDIMGFASFPTSYETLSPFLHERYLLVEEIGVGGSGFCLKIQRRADNRIFAAKLIAKDRIAKSALIRTLRWGYVPQGFTADQDGAVVVPVEAWALRRVSHANVCAFEELFADDTFYYLVRMYDFPPLSLPFPAEFFCLLTCLPLDHGAPRNLVADVAAGGDVAAFPAHHASRQLPRPQSFFFGAFFRPCISITFPVTPCPRFFRRTATALITPLLLRFVRSGRTSPPFQRAPCSAHLCSDPRCRLRPRANRDHSSGPQG